MRRPRKTYFLSQSTVKTVHDGYQKQVGLVLEWAGPFLRLEHSPSTITAGPDAHLRQHPSSTC